MRARPEHIPTEASARAFWNQRADAALRADVDAVKHAGTVTDRADVVGLRDRLEFNHLGRLCTLHPTLRVLDLAAGAGRVALRIAPRVAEITLVDLAENQLEIARNAARARGLQNVRFAHGSVLDVAVEGPYDLILMWGVLLYLSDSEVARMVERCAAWLAPGGRLILKEPVSTSGAVVEHGDERSAYRAHIRPREAYATAFAATLDLRYQSPTLAHPFPFFLRGTDAAVDMTRGKLREALVAGLAPVYARLDPPLLRIERVLRAHPLARRLLAPVEVMQDFYVFDKRAEVAVDLSVVVIAYNEAECLEAVAEELRTHLAGSRLTFEIVLVDDGSRDGTRGIMERLAARHSLFRVVALTPNRGIGGALRAGFDAAAGAYVTWVPADGQIPPEAVTTLFARRHEAPMLTTVYRTRADAWIRKLISHSLNTMIRVRTGQVAKSGGNYLFARKAWLEHGPRDDDTMMLSTAFRHNLRAAGEAIAEVEIDCRARVAGHSKVLNPRAIGRTLAQLLRMR